MKHRMSKLVVFMVALVMTGNLAGWRPSIGSELICLHRPTATCEPLPPFM